MGAGGEPVPPPLPRPQRPGTASPDLQGSRHRRHARARARGRVRSGRCPVGGSPVAGGVPPSSPGHRRRRAAGPGGIRVDLAGTRRVPHHRPRTGGLSPSTSPTPCATSTPPWSSSTSFCEAGSPSPPWAPTAPGSPSTSPGPVRSACAWWPPRRRPTPPRRCGPGWATDRAGSITWPSNCPGGRGGPVGRRRHGGRVRGRRTGGAAGTGVGPGGGPGRQPRHRARPAVARHRRTHLNATGRRHRSHVRHKARPGRADGGADYADGQ